MRAKIASVTDTSGIEPAADAEPTASVADLSLKTAFLGAVLLSPLVLLGLLLLFPSLDPRIMNFDLHFWAVGLTAVAAAMACVVLVVKG